MRLQSTVPGRALYTAIRDRVVRQITGGVDSLGHHFTKSNRTGRTGTGPDPEGAAFDDAVAGNAAALRNTTASIMSNMVALTTYVGFVLLIDPDALPSDSGRNAAEAMSTIADFAAEEIRAVLPAGGCSRWDHIKCDYRSVVQGLIYREFVGLGYVSLIMTKTVSFDHETSYICFSAWLLSSMKDIVHSTACHMV